MYTLNFEKRALNELNKLDVIMRKRIFDKLQACKFDPHRFIEHLAEIKGYKLRVGDYRILIDVDETKKILTVTKVGHRKNIYEQSKN